MKCLLPQYAWHKDFDDMFWVFGTQSKGFADKDIILDKQIYLEEKFGGPTNMNKSKGAPKKRGMYDDDSDEDDDLADLMAEKK